MATVTGFVGSIGRIRLSLDLTGNPTPTGGEILARAMLVADQNSDPVGGQNIEFYLGPASEGVVTTTDDGYAHITFPDLGFGTHPVAARIGGVAVTGRVTFSPQTAKAKPIKEPLVHSGGVDGKYTIHIACVHEDGGPAAGVVVKFIGTADGHPVAATRNTDENGFAEYEVSFREAERKIVVHCRGFQKEIVLRGLSSSSRPPKVPNWSADDREGGLWRLARRAWKRGGDDLRRRREE